VWFYDMKADGFSLDDKRNPIADNDIPDIIARFHNLEAESERTRKDQSFLVPVEEIREKGYDLSINKYKEIEREKVVYESSDVIIDRIASLEEEIMSALNDFRTKFM
jgi:type I restriction enzyme M protein